MKTCSRCKETKDFSLFDSNKSKKDGLSVQCKACKKDLRKAYYAVNKEAVQERNIRWQEDNPERFKELQDKAYRSHYLRDPSYYPTKASNRRSKELQATPSWSEQELIKTIYQKAKVYGAEVDHIVPLKSDLVCGLHVWANLQLLPKEDNRSKTNRHWPDQW